MLVVGQFLNDLLLNHTLPQSVYPPGRNSSSSDDFSQPLYSCPHYSQKDFLCLILSIFSGVPESYQVLRCQASTTEEELSIFLKRAENCHAQYLMLNINTLPFKLQEVSFNWVEIHQCDFCFLFPPSYNLYTSLALLSTWSKFIWLCRGNISSQRIPFRICFLLSTLWRQLHRCCVRCHG